MRPTPVRFLAAYLALSLCLGAVSAIPLALPPRRAAPASSSPAAARPVIVVDAGHGGEDGGAVAADGTLEKDLNLSVARGVAALLAAAGFDARLTREDDRLLYDRYGDLDDYRGQKKTYDLRNRLRFTEEAGAALLLSIHMNRFPQPEVRGLQVYYGRADPLSRALADAIQRSARTVLQPDNRRETKAADGSIYLLDRCPRPAVLVECGFLSNPQELALLCDSEYRAALALVIACAVAESLGAEGPS